MAVVRSSMPANMIPRDSLAKTWCEQHLGGHDIPELRDVLAFSSNGAERKKKKGQRNKLKTPGSMALLSRVTVVWDEVFQRPSK